MHDFFFDEVEKDNAIERLQKHPEVALNNASKLYNLSPKQQDIIKSHMFPVTFTPPKYLESWIVDIVDDVASIGERYKVITRNFRVVSTFMFMVILNYLKFK